MDFQFESFNALMWMKGHGPYVWASYVITLVGIILLGIMPRLQKKQLFKLLRAQKMRETTEQNSSSTVNETE